MRKMYLCLQVDRGTPSEERCLRTPVPGLTVFGYIIFAWAKDSIRKGRLMLTPS